MHCVPPSILLYCHIDNFSFFLKLFPPYRPLLFYLSLSL
uniref:Uncharacterized protein n=1 Tax=Podoviridae sp. ctx9R1 TaxID=2826589 RepID=A0A8S5LWJ7_9CAUD|nr:MAG TPA: hypothetical protein [Podoviridae sp. ctx9R1]